MFSNNLALNLKRVIELSNDILLVIEKQSIGKQSVRNVSDFFKNKYVEYTQAFGPLQEYLYSLSFNEIVEIETVMVVGRSGRKIYPKNFSTIDIFNYEKNNSFSYPDTENNKEYAIVYIIDKVAVLPEYLTKGAGILGISLY